MATLPFPAGRWPPALPSWQLGLIQSPVQGSNLLETGIRRHRAHAGGTLPLPATLDCRQPRQLLLALSKAADDSGFGKCLCPLFITLVTLARSLAPHDCYLTY